MLDAAGYMATFASILFGLAVADVAYSFHRLLTARRHVRFHWLPLTVAAWVTLNLVSAWWGYFPAFTRQDTSVAGFLPFVVSMIFLVLIAAAVLPDEVPEKLDLEQFYFDQHRYFWGMFSIYLGWIVLREFLVRPDHVDYRMLAWMVPTVAMMIAMAWTRRKWVHSILVPLIVAKAASTWLPWSLT